MICSGSRTCNLVLHWTHLVGAQTPGYCWLSRGPIPLESILKVFCFAFTILHRNILALFHWITHWPLTGTIEKYSKMNPLLCFTGTHLMYFKNSISNWLSWPSGIKHGLRQVNQSCTSRLSENCRISVRRLPFILPLSEQ